MVHALRPVPLGHIKRFRDTAQATYAASRLAPEEGLTAPPLPTRAPSLLSEQEHADTLRHMERQARRDCSSLLWGIVILTYILFAALIFLQDSSFVYGTPANLFGQIFNLLWFALPLYALGAITSVLLIAHLLRQTSTDDKRRIALPLLFLPIGAALINLYAATAIAINMDHYGIIPQTGTANTCQVVYSYGSGLANHQSGRVYISQRSPSFPSPTKYTWSRKGRNGVPDKEWEVQWESATGTLITHGQIGINPDTELPAHFTCRS